MVGMTLLFWASYAQPTPNDATKNEKKELRFDFNADGSHFLKVTFLNQIWMRYTENNPGTTVFGTRKSTTNDIGLRRTRIQVFGPLSDHVFVYTQIGTNNLTYNGARKQGLFFLDAIGELKLAGSHLSMGAGLTGWSGYTRYASPSVGSILSMDAPLYQQATNDVTDQFLRKFSVYAKGKLGKLDYRMALSTPMSIQNSAVQTATIRETSLFSSEPAKLQLQGYYMYQFLDQESNLIPYNTGSYLGKKRVFNFGTGFITQKDAMWHLENGSDTIRSTLGLFAVDVFYDAPVDEEKGTAITLYASYSINDFGKNYVRNLGVMNPANGVNNLGSFNGAGNAFPMIGTGTTFYTQAGYLLKNNLLGTWGTLQPYAATQISDFDLLHDTMLMYEGGLNWLLEGHRSKLSLNYQSRPVFTQDLNGDYQSQTRAGMWVLQMQVLI